MNAVFTTLSEITATASADGVEVTVNVEGRLVALTIDPGVLTSAPAEVAALVFRLTQAASATALTMGIEALAPFVDEELTAELRALTLPGPPAEEEFEEVRTWAVPR